MKLSIQPIHQEYFHQTLRQRPWGLKPYIAGNIQNRNLRKRRFNDHQQGQQQTLKGLLFVFFLLCMTIISREALADEYAQSGNMHFIGDDGTRYPALHLESSATFDIKGLHAQVQLRQSFTNQSEQWVEGVYVFPLPPNSAVSAMTMVIGERTITAEIREREEAKKIFTEAKKAGKKTALIEQERPNMFTQSIANIAPGETIEITLNYLQTVNYDMGKFSLRFPMTLTERFIPGNVVPGSVDHADSIMEYDNFKILEHGWATDQVADASRISPPQTTTQHQMSLVIDLSAGMDLALVESPSHPINVHIGKDKTYTISTTAHTIAMDKDFELVWRPVESNAPKAAVFHETLDGESFVQLMLLPPYVEPQNTTHDKHSTLSRELILIIDTSGSMQGQSIIQAKKSLTLAIQRLQSSDFFNVIEFNSQHRTLFDSPVAANSKNINTALQLVNNLRADGGTNMAPALEAALLNHGNQELLRQVVFVTDGAVGNEEALFKLIHQNLNSARLFTVGIGSAPNSYFMEKSAQFGRGTFTHIGNIDQVDERMSELFRKLESPVMSGIQVDWPSGWDTEAYPTRIPDLYLGEPLLITAKATPQFTGQEHVNIFGNIVGKNWQREIPIPAPTRVYIQKNHLEAKDKRAIISSYWARFKIEALLDQKTLGGDPQEIKQQVVPVALKYQLMSPFTSFIAVEESVSRPAEESLNFEAIANSKPAGQSAQSISYPQTATSASFNLLMGFITLFIAFIVARLTPKNNENLILN